MAYFNAWASMRYLVIEQGLSWSGREKDHLFLNLGDGTFAELSALSAADDLGDGRGLAVIDWDDDGKLDVFLKNRTAPRVAFYRNRMASAGHHVAFELRGVRCNRDAIGARVEVEAGGRTLRKTLHAGEGYLAQSSKRLHFGLGSSTRVERLRVSWPDGSRAEFADLPADRGYEIVQDEAAPRALPVRAKPVLAAAEPPAPAPARAVVRVPLVEKLPLGALRVPGFEAEGRTVRDLAGGPVLLNLWSPACAACMEEFGEWRARRADIQRAGLRLVPLCADEGTDREQALETLRRFDLARDAGIADAAFLEALDVLVAEVVESQKTLPLPTSLLLDERGQLVLLYLGRIELERLLEDVGTLSKMNPAQHANVRLLGGLRVLPRGRDLAALAERFRLAGQAELAGYYAALASAPPESPRGGGAEDAEGREARPR
jgi:hypothetical protein